MSRFLRYFNAFLFVFERFYIYGRGRPAVGQSQRDDEASVDVDVERRQVGRRRDADGRDVDAVLPTDRSRRPPVVPDDQRVRRRVAGEQVRGGARRQDVEAGDGGGGGRRSARRPAGLASVQWRITH